MLLDLEVVGGAGAAVLMLICAVVGLSLPAIGCCFLMTTEITPRGCECLCSPDSSSCAKCPFVPWFVMWIGGYGFVQSLISAGNAVAREDDELLAAVLVAIVFMTVGCCEIGFAAGWIYRFGEENGGQYCCPCQA